MDTDIWLPLATLVLGWAGSQVTAEPEHVRPRPQPEPVKLGVAT
jgi:hypothetical protein